MHFEGNEVGKDEIPIAVENWVVVEIWFSMSQSILGVIGFDLLLFGSVLLCMVLKLVSHLWE